MIQVTTSCGAEIHFVTSLLQLRGTNPSSTPLTDARGNCLAFNGEAGHMHHAIQSFLLSTKFLLEFYCFAGGADLQSCGDRGSVLGDRRAQRGERRSCPSQSPGSQRGECRVSAIRHMWAVGFCLLASRDRHSVVWSRRFRWVNSLPAPSLFLSCEAPT